jgi:hypothetical protein
MIVDVFFKMRKLLISLNVVPFGKCENTNWEHNVCAKIAKSISPLFTAGSAVK